MQMANLINMDKNLDMVNYKNIFFCVYIFNLNQQFVQ